MCTDSKSSVFVQIKELEAGGGVKPQDSKIDTGMGAKRKVHKTNI